MWPGSSNLLCDKNRPPKDMGEKEISQHISRLATQRKVASSTQNQALNVRVLLYKHILRIELGDFGHLKRAKRPERLPTVITQTEVGPVLAAMSGPMG